MYLTQLHTAISLSPKSKLLAENLVGRQVRELFFEIGSRRSPLSKLALVRGNTPRISLQL